MSQLESTMKSALAARPDVAAIACMDGRAGLVLGMYVNGDVSPDLVELVALSAPELLSTPSLGGVMDEPNEECPEAFALSDAWVHAFVRVPDKPDLVVLGLAGSGTNVSLLQSWLREVAGRVGREP